MRAHIDRRNDSAVIAADRHRDRAEPRLGLAIDQRIVLRAIAPDSLQQALFVGHGERRERREIHCLQRRRKFIVG